MAKVRECRDCKLLPANERPKVPRPITSPGPRCSTHARVRRAALKARNHELHVAKTYGLPPGLYDEILKAQGGRCAWCQLAEGKSRRLAVDHDHACCPGSISCGRCVRGLLCSPCNQFLGFQMRDNLASVRRGIEYLRFPPAQAVIMAWSGSVE